jgi:hypothetical protein
MEISKLRKWLGASALTVALSVSGGLVLAQDAPVPPPPGDPAAAPAAGPAAETKDDEVQENLGKQAELTGTEMQGNADGLLAKMREVLKRVVEVRGIAKRQKDIIKLNCVNDKLLQVKQLLNIAESSRTNLDASIADNDESGRYDYYTNIVYSHDQTLALGAEAENCIGEDLSYLGPSETTVEGGDEPDDPTQTEDPDFPEVELPPAQSSPT